MFGQRFSDLLKICAVLPEDEPAFPVAAHPALLPRYYLASTVGTESDILIASHKCFCSFYNFIGVYQIGNHVGDFPHELLWRILSMLDLGQLFFPVSSHGGGLNLLRGHGDQRLPCLRRDQVLHLACTLALQIPFLDELFDGRSSGCRGSNALAFCILGEFIGTGRFHRLQEQILSEMLWRCGFPFLDFCLCDRNDSVCFGIGDRFLRAGLFREELIHDAFPALTDDHLAFGGENLTCTFSGYGGLNKPVRLRNSCQQPNRNQSQNLLFSLGEGFEIHTGNRNCGDDGMVIGYLFAVDDLFAVQNHFTVHME